MQTSFQLTPKQAEYIRNANHRWNVACGAVRSGKSYCQISYCIPTRLMERKGMRGLRVILGATRDNIERNILSPMRDLYGDSVATGIDSKNTCKILGEKVYCIGADNARQVSKIRGSEIAYCAIDEAIDLNQEVFEMLKSRLSLPWSCCDVTTNPSYPQHWFKQFIDSAADGVDIYCQTYSIYDNPFLPPDYVKNLETEYKNTVWFTRYIRGEWCVAEGLVYDFGEGNITDEKPDSDEFYISIDYGTMNPFSAGLWCLAGGKAVRIAEYYYSGRTSFVSKTDEEYCDAVERLADGRRIKRVVVDPSAASFIAALRKRGFTVIQANNEVMDGIRRVAEYLRSGNIKIHRDCRDSIAEFGLYRWDEKATEDKVIKENDHAMDDIRYFANTILRHKVKRGREEDDT